VGCLLEHGAHVRVDGRVDSRPRRRPGEKQIEQAGDARSSGSGFVFAADAVGMQQRSHLLRCRSSTPDHGSPFMSVSRGDGYVHRLTKRSVINPFIPTARSTPAPDEYVLPERRPVGG
jgi:hypothetical protein